MTSREQFEAWLSKMYEWADDTLDMAFFYGDDETGYYTGGDFIYDGRSCSDALFWAWRGWQASRNALEIKLPPAINTEEIGVAISKERTMARLAFAGIKVK